MGLAKCKECGGEVSTSAKNCPKCGAKPPKKTSLFTWMVLIVIVISVYSSLNDTGTSTSSASTAKSSNVKTIEPVKVTQPRWDTSRSKNEMTGKNSSYAHSPSTFSTKPMSFPYSDVKAWLGIGCDSDSEWAYIGFNEAPNLNDDETEDGYNAITTKIKWDESIEETYLTQKWGAEFLHFKFDTSAIEKIQKNNKVLLSLQWHGQGTVYFDFTLRGSSAALKKIRSECARKT